MITKASYIEMRSASLRAMDIEIARLMDYADRSTADIAAKYYEAIDRLQQTRDKATELLRGLLIASDEAPVWQIAAAGVEEAWKEIRDAVLAAISTTYCEANRRSSARHLSAGPHTNNRAGRIAPRGSCY